MNQAIIEAKKAYVAEIAEKMKNAESTVVVEYRGLTVAEMTERYNSDSNLFVGRSLQEE